MHIYYWWGNISPHSLTSIMVKFEYPYYLSKVLLSILVKSE